MKSSKSDNIFSNISSIKEYDRDLWTSFENEAQRQEDHIAVSYTHLRAHETP